MKNDLKGLQLVLVHPDGRKEYQVQFFDKDFFERVKRAAEESGKCLTPADEDGWWKVVKLEK